MKILRYGFILLLLPSCLQDDEKNADSQSVSEKDSSFRIMTDSNGITYFPEGKESYYTPLYRAAGLPSLQTLKLDKGKTQFRVAYIPSFTKPLFLSYARDEKGGAISVVRLSGRGAGNEGPGEIELQGTIHISNDAADAFEGVAAWKETRDPLGALDQELLPLYEGLDGERWILEVVTSDGYTMTDVWSPTSFEFYEKDIREYYDNTVSKNPKTYNLPERFSDYKLPDLDVSAFVTFCEDVLTVADVKLSEDSGWLMPRQRP